MVRALLALLCLLLCVSFAFAQQLSLAFPEKASALFYSDLGLAFKHPLKVEYLAPKILTVLPICISRLTHFTDLDLFLVAVNASIKDTYECGNSILELLLNSNW